MNYGGYTPYQPNINPFQLGAQGSLPPSNLPNAPPEPGAAPVGAGAVGNSGLDPRVAGSYMQMAAMKPYQEQIDYQRKLADYLRASGSKQLQGTQAGRVYVAPGIANLLGSLASSYAGMNLDQQARQGGLDLVARQGRVGRNLIAGITGKPLEADDGVMPPNPDAGGGWMQYFKQFLPGGFGG